MRVERTCRNPICGKVFFIADYRVARGKGQYCSQACLPRRQPCTCHNPACGTIFTATPSIIARGGGKFCSRACSALLRQARLPRICQNPDCGKIFFLTPARIRSNPSKFCCSSCIRHYTSFSERFWIKVQRCSHGEACPFCCWEWQGSRRADKWAYGHFSVKIDGRWMPINTQRIAWELHNQRHIPKGLFGCHYCSNPPCCNPQHIYPGTALDNSRDAVKLGSFIDRYHGIPAQGESLPQAKLTAEKVIVMRQMYKAGNMLKTIAEVFNISVPNTHTVVHYKSWKHIP